MMDLNADIRQARMYDIIVNITVRSTSIYATQN